MKVIFEAKKPDEQVTAELEALYPQFDFSNVEYYFDDGSLSPNMKGTRYLNNLYCPIKHKNDKGEDTDIPHGVSNNLKVDSLYRGKGGCRECRRLNMGGKKVDFDEYVKNFPKDKEYNFGQSKFYRDKTGNTERRYVKNVFCTKKDKDGSTHGFFAKDGVNIDNLRRGTTGCPKCRNAEGSVGAKKLNDILIEKGYKDFKREKKFSDCKSGKESNRCTQLKFDFYLKDKENRDILVEYDGEPHFKPNAKHGGEEAFEERVINDTIKNQYTSQNNIKLIRIAYTDFGNLEEELLAGLESPNQLYLSSTYPLLGWNDPKLLPTQSSESKIKRDYILTESQLKVIVEHKSDFITKLKRRFNEKTMRDFIYHAETEFPDPCSKFDNEFEFADAIIGAAVTEFLFQEDLEYHFHSGDWSVIETENLMITMCKEWFEDGLLGFHQTTCQDEFDDEDFDVMSEEYEIASDKVIVRLFKLFNEYKKTAKTKKELLNIIMEYLPLFGISKVYAIYMLELYLLNFREDGDYSGLNKNNFIDPRNKSGKKTANYQAGDYTKAQLPFQGSNLEGRWTKDRNGVKYYVVKSYGWYPVYIYKEGKWYENFDRYSSSTGKQMNNARPYTYNNEIDSKVYLMSKNEMELLERGVSHEDVMKKKKESFRDVKPSPKISTTKSSYGEVPSTSIKFKISSVEETDDVNIVNVDIYDVLKTRDGVQIDTPENYLKGEIPNVTPEKVEKEVERKLRQNFRQYLGPKLGNQDEELVTFRFNHLKK
jgi:hypothetical protein